MPQPHPLSTRWAGGKDLTMKESQKDAWIRALIIIYDGTDFEVDWEYAENLLPYIDDALSWAHVLEYVLRPTMTRAQLAESLMRVAIGEPDPQWQPEPELKEELMKIYPPPCLTRTRSTPAAQQQQHSKHRVGRAWWMHE